MARVIDVRDGRPSGAAHWVMVGGAVLVAAVIGIGLARGLAGPAASEAPAVRQAPAAPAAKPAPAKPPPALPARTVLVDAAPAAAEAAPPVDCRAPMQALTLALGPGAPLTVCAGATQVRQMGSMRSYLAQDGGRQWVLQVDTAGGEVIKVALQGRDGRAYACEGSDCAGVTLGRHDARGTRQVTLRSVALRAGGATAEVGAEAGSSAEASGPTASTGAAGAARAMVSARLAVGADDHLPGLACTGPSVAISAPDGASQKFCGQGGAGFDIADDGTRTYQFQDFEGRTLAIRLDAQHVITRVSYGSHACEGAACAGATMSAAEPDNDAAERSFFFGRTTLFDAGGSSTRAGLQLNGSLVLQGQP